MGATADGKKELIAINDGYRESAASWKEVPLDCQLRGLGQRVGDPKLATGDRALGFWAAIGEVWPSTLAQRGRGHKTSKGLNKMPRSLHGKAESMLHDIWMAEIRAMANKAFDLFVETFKAKYPKAIECLVKDREALLPFYSFPPWALGSPAHDESDRVDVLGRSPADGQEEGLRITHCVPDDGVQARPILGETPASDERFPAHCRGHRRRGVHRWSEKGRRLIMRSYTRFGNTPTARYGLRLGRAALVYRPR